MKKLGLLLHSREKDDFLGGLQRLGVVHIETSSEADSAELERAVELKSRYERTLKNLRKLKKEKKLEFIEEVCIDPESVLAQFDTFSAKATELERKLKEKEREIALLKPWGDFDPEKIVKLTQLGLEIRFFEVPKKYFKTLSLKDLHHHIIRSDKEHVCFVVLDSDKPVSIRPFEVRPPNLRFSETVKECNELEREKEKVEAQLDRLTAFIDSLAKGKLKIEDMIDFKEVELHMKGEIEGALLSMTGWLPEEKESELRAFLDDEAACFIITDPGENDHVPVLLKNGIFTKLFEPITKIFSLPAYYELDPTPFFAPFFALFFGLCLADLGYGIVIFIATLLLAFKGPSKLRPIFMLGMVLGLLTIVGGLVLNTFFGEPLFILPGSEKGLFASGKALAPLAAYSEGGQMVFPGLIFALMLGFIQVILGMSLNAINSARQSGALFAIQPLSYIMMVFGGLIAATHADVMSLASLTAGPLPLGETILKAPLLAGQSLLASGLLLLFLFNNAGKKFLVRPALGLWELYGFATGLMGDILSYLRLFALGLAGGLLGNAFNQIAFMFITDSHGVVHYASFGIIGTLLVLIFGHTLNLGLAMLGGFVHSLRLTFVEFYKNLNFKGGGKAFSPFSLHAKMRDSNRGG